MSGIAPVVEHGFVIVKSNGFVWDEYLYGSREAAEHIARVAQQGLTIHPARRIRSIRQATATTARGWTDLIIDRGAE